MKHRNILLALASFLAGIGVATVVPALAQQGGTNDAWEITVIPYGNQSWSAIKHNTSTGTTLVLNCDRGCDEQKEAWLEFPIKAVN